MRDKSRAFQIQYTVSAHLSRGGGATTRKTSIRSYNSLFKIRSSIIKMLNFTPNVEGALKDIIHATVTKVFPQIPSVEPLITKGKVAEYQCNNAMGLAKTLSQQKPPVKLSPQAIGEELRKGLVENDVIEDFEPTPQGFINVNIKKSYISTAIRYILEHGVQPPEMAPKRVLVDFSSPNIAKEMHVGHLRSTIIGDSICLLLEFCGHDVERINHVGDWGTAFGMLILYIKRNYPDFLDNPPDISDLTAFYRAAKECFDASPEFKEQARLEVVKLQAYEEPSMAAWKFICQVSRDEFNKIYSRLNVRGLTERGESFYNELIPKVLGMLDEAGLTEESDGAKLVVSKEWKDITELGAKEMSRLVSQHLAKKTKEGPYFHPNLLSVMRQQNILSGEEGQEVVVLKKKETKPLAQLDFQTEMDKLVAQLAPTYKKTLDPLLLEAFTSAGVVKDNKIAVPRFNFPLMVRKSDGGYTYDTTDVTCCYHRFVIAKKERVIYCTDLGQYEHLRMCVQAAMDMNWMGPEASWDHGGFGLVTGADGKKIKTRSGETAKLKDLIDEACDRALAVLKEREDSDRAQGHTEEEMQKLSQVLGVAAIKYYDLKQNRTSDYTFNYDKMLDTAGNTAIFILYQYARMSSIRRKANVSDEEVLNAGIQLDTPAEKKLGLCLLRFQSVVQKTSEDLLLHHLTDFAYELVCHFSDFFTNCKVVGDPLQNSRLCLMECVQATLRKTMELLNIPVVDRM
eukprot:gene8676-6099_t